MPAALAIAAPVQWVASCGGSVAVRATTLSMTSWPSGGTRGGRVLSRRRPVDALPRQKRSCQRQTQVFDLPVAPHDLDRAEAIGRKQHDLGPPGMLLRGVAVAEDRLQAAAIGGGEVDGYPGAHAPDSHAAAAGNPPRIQMSDAIHLGSTTRVFRRAAATQECKERRCDCKFAIFDFRCSGYSKALSSRSVCSRSVIGAKRSLARG